ncbi:MAG: DUF21 domain-containing protein [Verrucomicrobia bacterium]|jgi:metal transporter CNNM|nr:DUF21 domain-containing protein [Verrucomicrobiota bacterium]MBT7068832.1 DUF21 domain-containing protein [Verrucomicrobiota bacterium]MBT7699888.1 DUF21 domain-containing protein [Verrucomicrobiota bacterium]
MRLRILIFITALVGIALAAVGLVVEQVSVAGMTVELRWMSWAIFLCGYAVCSGANVAYFALSRRDLRKMIWRGRNAPEGGPAALQAMRASALLEHLQNPNWTLASILFTNVGFGVYLSQLSDTLFIGVFAVVMPVLSITVFGEFFAQATFLRYAGRICYVFSPLIWVLKWITSPVSYPLARAIDALYGKNPIKRLDERDLLSDLELELEEWQGKSMHPHEHTLDPVELKTLMNAARADDEPAREAGQLLDPKTIVPLEFDGERPVFPELGQFIRETLSTAAHPWFVLTDAKTGQPRSLLDVDGFVRSAYAMAVTGKDVEFNPHDHTFAVRVYHDPDTRLREVVSQFRVHAVNPRDDVIDVDVALIWTSTEQWIVTGGDVLGRFLRGVAKRYPKVDKAEGQGSRDRKTGSRTHRNRSESMRLDVSV